MTLNEFIAKWTDKYCNYDLAFGPQCTDLARTYIKEVTGTKQFAPVIGAKDIWKQELDGFDKVPNTPDGIPPIGAIIIWGATYGKFGHVAISLGGTKDTFQAFSQNDPADSKCVMRGYKSYASVLGWFTPRGIIDTTMADDIRVQLLNENGLKTEYQVRDALAKYQGYDQVQKDLTNTKAEVEKLNVSVEALMKAKEDMVIEIQKNVTEAKLWKEKHETFVATIAKALGTTQDDARIIPAIDELIARSDKLQDIVDERPVISATPIHKLLEEILQYLKKLIIKKEDGNKV